MFRTARAKLVVAALYFLPLTAGVTILLTSGDYIIGTALVVIEVFVFTSTRIAARPGLQANQDRIRPVRGTTDADRPPRAAREGWMFFGAMIAIPLALLIIIVIAIGTTRN